MQQRLPLWRSPALNVSAALGASVWTGLAVGVAVLFAVYLGLGLALLRALPAPAFDLVAIDPDAPVPVETPLVLQTLGWGTTVEDVTLIEFALDPEGRILGEREVPVRFEPSTEGRLPGERRGRIVGLDGRSPLVLDAWYELTVRGHGTELTWQGPRDVPLVEFRAFGTPHRAQPHLPTDAVVAAGEALTISWNVPVAEFTYTLTPPGRSRSWLSEDGLVAYIQLEDFAQGARYQVEVTGARTALGAPLAAPASAAFTTPPALRVVDFAPGNGARDVAPSTDPVLTFSAPVANPDAAERAIRVDPPTEGHFRWLDPTRVQFVTESGFPYSTDVSLTVEPGPEGLRAVDGGFVEDEVTLAFRTRPHKRIDVNLTRQTVTLLEDDKPVYTTIASTGVRGAETPVGNFTVQYKLPKTRMRGVNPDGSRYDIPDVPWVMALFGDYTLHGAPWRQAWGIPQSNGCVSMPTAAAKFVYDWTPVGTPVTIHY
jgi:lipoprotein-anchoring transpeptidase ErfK/SrfK